MATFTITTPTTDDSRILKSFGAELGMARDATGPEVKQALIDYMKAVVTRQEHKALVAAVTDPAPVNPT